MEIPEPEIEGPVSIYWYRSNTDPRKIVSLFQIDFGKTDIDPIKAANINLAIVRLLRQELNVKLTRHVD